MTYSYQAHGSYVYFVVSAEQNAVKIGYTTHLAGRLAFLQSGNPATLELRAAVPGGALLEREMHSRFSQFYRGGEWFTLQGDLAEFLDQQVPPPEVTWKRRDVRYPGRGNPANLTPEVRRKGWQASSEAAQARADAHAESLRPAITEIHKSGATSMRQIACALNARGFVTPRGKQWNGSQVARVLRRLGLLT